MNFRKAQIQRKSKKGDTQRRVSLSLKGDMNSQINLFATRGERIEQLLRFQNGCIANKGIFFLFCKRKI